MEVVETWICTVVTVCVPFLSVCSTSAWWREWFWNCKFWLQDELPKLIFSYYRLEPLLVLRISHSTIVFHVTSSAHWGQRQIRTDSSCVEIWGLSRGFVLFVEWPRVICEWTCHGVLVWWCDDSPTGAKVTPAYQYYGLLLVPHTMPLASFSCVYSQTHLLGTTQYLRLQ